MERVKNGRVGQRGSRLTNDVVPEEKGMLKVNDVRLKGLQEIVIVFDVDLLIALGSVQPV